MDLQKYLLFAHAASTLFMVGVIWFVQIVHYPLFGRVGVEKYSGYQAAHMFRTSFVVLPPMLIELASALLLLIVGASEMRDQYAIGLFLLALIWLSTFCLQVPAHRILELEFNQRAHKKLVRTNWIRTVLWSLRGVLALYWLASAS